MGISFNGGNQKAVLNNINLLNGWTEYSISCWIKSNETNSDQGWINFIEPNGQDRFGGPRYDAGGANAGGVNSLKFGLEINGSEKVIEARDNAQTTELQHIVGRWRSGDPTELFIDNDASGVQDQDSAVTGSISASPDIIVGQGPKESSTTSFNGIIYEIRVFERWLTDQEIETMYNLKGSDDFYGGLRLWYKFLDASFGQSPSTLFDWSDSNYNLPVTGSPIMDEAVIAFRRR
mgnify:FL=1